MTFNDLLIGAVFAGVIAFVAWRARALTSSGAPAAFVVGTLTFAGGGVWLTLVLLAFFVPSVALSRVGRARKTALVDVGKHGARDALQVLANGGVATACVVALAYTHDLRWAFAFAGAYAAVTADTWATEIGTLIGGTPRSIITLRRIATGMSGGVTVPGTLAEIAGAVWIGVVAYWAFVTPFASQLRGYGLDESMALFIMGFAGAWWRAALAVPLGGIAGATLDSVLGATLQELRFCDACGRSCETDPHACGSPTWLVRGVPRFSNDVVNLLASAAGAAVAFTLVPRPP